jgi:glycosyltransferase involved in cell wall biosynthesis
MIQKKLSLKHLATAQFLGRKPKGSIEGYIEKMNEVAIEGWVINKTGQSLQLSLRLADRHYPITISWHERADVALRLGAEYSQSGFSLIIPQALREQYLSAVAEGQLIEVFANDVRLVNNALFIKQTWSSEHVEVSPASPTDTLSTVPALRGFIENVDEFEVCGWGFSVDHAPLSFTLRIGDAEEVIDALTWHERPDVAAIHGEEFKRSGFSFIVPDALMDAYLATLTSHTMRLGAQQPVSHALSVWVNGVCLDSKPQITSKLVKMLPEHFSFATMVKINAEHGVYFTSKELLQLFKNQLSYALRISPIAAVNAKFYSDLAKEHLMQHKVEAGQTYLKTSLFFDKRAEAFELLGNTYFEQKKYYLAYAYYHYATQAHGVQSRWLYANLINCKKNTTDAEAILRIQVEALIAQPSATYLNDRLDELVQDYWLSQQGLLESLCIVNDRQTLLTALGDISAFIYSVYLRSFGATEPVKTLGQCDLNRVLIIADLNIPQCVRYRVTQKIEQLELIGKEVTLISWLDLPKEFEALLLHDVVIFYRVPAEPPILKAMAQVNATGKLGFYEIDDYLFDSEFPPPIETYGGYLELTNYFGILKGMAMFNAAAKYCRFGIASTQLLADKLSAFVFSQRCFVHRNGVDSKNIFKNKVLSEVLTNNTIEIFYGSGTMAHNSDFNDLALPALKRIFDEYPTVRLTIVGYLKLPSAVVKQYADKIKQIPPVKNINAYWRLLDRADINLAVLLDDEINGCKSELKWFEAACLGIPSVLSTTANYRDVIQHGQDGLIATTTEDWYQHLKVLVEQPETRLHIAAQAQMRVQQEYSQTALANNMATILQEALQAAQPLTQPLRKKIALVNVFFPPQSIGGGTRVVVDNFDTLQIHYGDQFELCVFTSDAEQRDKAHQLSVYQYQGARVYRATIQWREHMDWAPRDEKIGELFAQFLTVEQPDVIHFHCVQRLSGSMLEHAFDAGIPYVVTIHDAWWISDYQFLVDANNKVYPDGHPDLYQHYTPASFTDLSTSLERIIYLQDLLKKAAAVLTVSDCFANIYRKNEITNICTNKNGIAETLPWAAKDTRYTDKVVCGHVGGMAEHKGYFLLKNAVMSYQPKNIHMLIVDHAYDEDYRLDTFWGDVPVTFIGRMTQRRVVDLYRQIDVLWAPSIWPESYGLVTREAAACGCWVVASAMGGIGEDVIEDRTGHVIAPTIENIIEVLTKIASEPTRYKALPETSSIRSVYEQVKELVEIYHTVQECKK